MSNILDSTYIRISNINILIIFILIKKKKKLYRSKSF